MWQLPRFYVSETFHVSPSAKLSLSFHAWSSVYHIRGHFSMGLGKWVNWWNKCLPCKHAGLCSGSQNPHEKQSLVTCTCDPSTGQGRTGGYRRVCGSHWIASLDIVSSKCDLESHWGGWLLSTSAKCLHVCARAPPTGTHTWTCMLPSIHRRTLFSLPTKLC